MIYSFLNAAIPLGFCVFFVCVWGAQLDPVLMGLDADMKVAGSEEDEQGLKKQIKAREDALLPMYLQVI